MSGDDAQLELLGRTLRQARKAAGMSLPALATKQLGSKDHAMLSRVERGTQKPSDSVLLAYAREFSLNIDELRALVPPDRRSRRRPKSIPLDCLVEQEVILDIDGDGVPIRQEVRWELIALKDGLKGQALMAVPTAEFEQRDFRDIRGGTLETKPYNERPQVPQLGLYLRFFEPLQECDHHELAVTYTPFSGNRTFVVSPADRMQHRQLIMKVWVPSSQREGVAIYGVNGYPMAEPMPPPLDGPSCKRMYPSSNGLVSWAMPDLAYRERYGVTWRGRTPGYLESRATG